MEIKVDLKLENCKKETMKCPYYGLVSAIRSIGSEQGLIFGKVVCSDGILIDVSSDEVGLSILKRFGLVPGKKCPMCRGNGKVCGEPFGYIRDVRVSQQTGVIIASNKVYRDVQELVNDWTNARRCHAASLSYDYTTVEGEKTCMPLGVL